MSLVCTYKDIPGLHLQTQVPLWILQKLRHIGHDWLFIRINNIHICKIHHSINQLQVWFTVILKKNKWTWNESNQSTNHAVSAHSPFAPRVRWAGLNPGRSTWTALVSQIKKSLCMLYVYIIVVIRKVKEKESFPLSWAHNKLLQECQNIEQTEFTLDTLPLHLYSKESQRVYVVQKICSKHPQDFIHSFMEQIHLLRAFYGPVFVLYWNGPWWNKFGKCWFTQNLKYYKLIKGQNISRPSNKVSRKIKRKDCNMLQIKWTHNLGMSLGMSSDNIDKKIYVY